MSEKTPEQLTESMLRNELYVVTTKPARSPQTKALLPSHLEHQIKLEREGKLFGAGPIYEDGEDVPVAGMIVLRAANFEEARMLADTDPMHKHGARTYTLQRWLMNEGSLTVTMRFSDQSLVIGE
jgi:uncharacterized protein YciI